jgi:hypothetical protein
VPILARKDRSLANTIPLDRQFAEWSEAESSDPELRFRFSTYGVKTWDDLLRKPRVVILAEAGSGESEELKAQTARKVGAVEFSFYATVQDVGRKGVSGALRAGERTQLEAWRNSDRTGWFFIDSVDEAKLDGVRLDQAFRELGTAIHGAEARAHIVLSGRLTDWEFQRDLQRFSDELPIIAAKDNLLPELSPDELVVKTIRLELPKHEEGKSEKPFVVAMLPLDPSRVELFAAARGIQGSDLGEFIAQINAANLWHFARRPLDLDWMVQFWRTHHRLGSLSEMLENSLAERLREPNLDRTRRDRLDAERAFQGMERIGAALIFGRTKTITIPDSTLSLHDTSPPLDLADVLSDWSAEDRALLLTRPVFDPATFGRARVHNDNQGVVSAFLAARWLLRLRASNLSRAATHPLASLSRGGDLVTYALADQLPFELGEGYENVQGHSAHGILGVERLGNGHEGDAMALEQLDQIQEVEHRPGEPIDLVDDDDVDLPRVDVGQEAFQCRSFQGASREAAIVIMV